jgi:predicted transcriptional regulator
MLEYMQKTNGEFHMMNTNIVRLDMHLRDERLLDLLYKHNNKQLTTSAIANQLLCHRNTVSAMLQRLEYAGRVKINRYNKRGGYSYTVLDIESCEKFH